MLKNQKLILCFSFIIALFFSLQTLATEYGVGERDGEEEGYRPRHLTIRKDNSLKIATSLIVDEKEPETAKKMEIETALYHTVQYLGKIPESGIKAGAAITTAGASVLCTQALPASTMETLYQLGALNNVTQDGAEPLLIAAASGGLPIAVGMMETYDAVVEAFKTETPEVKAAKLITNERSTSCLERWVDSTPTHIIRFLFFGTMMFCYYLNLEYRVDGWGNTRFGDVFSVWGLVMGVASLFITYVAFNRPPLRNPNKNPYLFNKTPEERKEKKELLELGHKTVLVIQDKGLTTEVLQVAQAFNLASKEIGTGSIQEEPKEDTPILRDKLEELHEETSSAHNSRRDSVSMDMDEEDQSTKHRYEIVLKKESRVQRTLSPLQKYLEWGASGAAYYIAPVFQSPSLFIKPMFAYAFFNQLTTYSHGSPELAMGIGIGLTIGLFTHLGLGTIGEIPFTFAEVKQTLLGFKSQLSVGSDSSGLKYVGGAILNRAAPLLARCATFLCIPETLKIFLVKEVLIKTYGITSVPLQNFIITAFFVGTVWPATAQIFDKNVTRMKNWLEMGAPVTYPWCCTCSFKLFPCVDRDGTKAMLFALQNQIGDQLTTLESFGPECTRLALEAVRQPSTSSLLVSNEVVSANDAM